MDLLAYHRMRRWGALASASACAHACTLPLQRPQMHTRATFANSTDVSLCYLMQVERWLGQQQSPGSHSLSPLPKPSSHGMPSTKPPAATATLRDSVDSSIAGVLPSIDLCEDWLPTDTEVESYLGRAPSLTQASSTPRPAAQSPQGPTEAAPVHTRVSVSQLTSSIPTKAAQQGTPTSSPLRYQHTGSVSPLQNSKHERSSQHSEARRPAQHKRATAPGQLRSAKSTGQHAVASAEHAAALQWRPSTGSLGVKHMAAPQIAVAEDANMLAEAALALSQQVRLCLIPGKNDQSTHTHTYTHTHACIITFRGLLAVTWACDNARTLSFAWS